VLLILGVNLQLVRFPALRHALWIGLLISYPEEYAFCYCVESQTVPHTHLYSVPWEKLSLSRRSTMPFCFVPAVGQATAEHLSARQ
jgi:hypothetical protein